MKQTKKRKWRLKRWVAIVLQLIILLGFALMLLAPVFATHTRIGGEHLLVVFVMIILPAIALDKYYWNK